RSATCPTSRSGSMTACRTTSAMRSPIGAPAMCAISCAAGSDRFRPLPAPAAGRGRARYANLAPPKRGLLAAEAAEIAVVSLEHVGKQYDTGAPILADVSIALERGGFYFLTGVSGAGKTTLLRIIHLAE